MYLFKKELYLRHTGRLVICVQSPRLTSFVTFNVSVILGSFLKILPCNGYDVFWQQCSVVDEREEGADDGEGVV